MWRLICQSILLTLLFFKDCTLKLKSFDKFTQAYFSSDSNKLDRHIHRTHFYDHNDKSIVLARTLRNGEKINPAFARQASQKKSTTSLYAQAIASGIELLQAANRYFQGNLDQTTLKKKLAA